MAQDTPQDPQQDRPVSLDEFEEQRRQYYGIPKGLSVALRTQESGGKQYDKNGGVLTSPKNAKGRYQVLPDTAARYGLNADDPFENTEAAFRYMADLHKKVDPSVKDPGERWASVVAGYHSGEGGLNKINKTGKMPGTNDGLIKTDDYVSSIMKRWQQHDAGDTGTPTAQPASQPEAAPLRPVRRDQVPGPQKTTARGPVLPRDSNPFAINQGATGFQQQAQAANARTGQISPEVQAEADRRGRELTRFNQRSTAGKVAEVVAQGGMRGMEGLAKAGKMAGAIMSPGAPGAVMSQITQGNPGLLTNAAEKNLQGQEAAANVAMPNTAPVVRGTASALTQLPAAVLAGAGGTVPAMAGNALLQAGQEDWRDPKHAAIRTALGATLPIAGGHAAQAILRPASVAGRLASGAVGGAAGNVLPAAAEQVMQGRIDPQELAQQAVIGAGMGAALPPSAYERARPVLAERPGPLTRMNTSVVDEGAPVQGGYRPLRSQGDYAPIRPDRPQETQITKVPTGEEYARAAKPAEPQAAPGQPEAPAQSALPQERLAGIRVLGEAERVPMRDRARAKSIVYSDENGVPQNVRVLLPEGMSLGDAKRVLRDARKYQAQQSAESAPAQSEATPATPENPRNRAISRGREIEQQARAEADAAIQEGRHDDARAALKRRIAALQDTRANIKRDTPGAVSLRAQLGEQIFRTQEELRGLKTSAQRPVRPAPEVRPPGNEPTRDLTTPFPQAARVEPTTPLAQAEAPARKTADLSAREQVQPQAQEVAQAPVVPATPTPAAQRPVTSANARRRYGRGMDEAVTVHFENQADALRFDASKRGRHAAIGPEADQVVREFGVDRREAIGAIYDWRRTVEAAAKSAKPGTDVPGPSFAEFVRARQQSAAQVPEARTPQPPTGPLTEPTNRLQGAEYAGSELPRTAGLRPEGQPVEIPAREKEPWQMTREEFEGQPGIVYHGTDAEPFSRFDEAKFGSTTDAGLLGRGAYFSTDKNISRNKKNAILARVNVKTPLRISMPTWEANKSELASKALGLSKTLSGSELTEAARKQGYDGIVLDYSPLQYNHQEIVAFDAQQALTHKGAVEQAIREGKQVPSKVLDQYPDLRPVDPIDAAPEAKPYEVSDQMARRRQEREAALKGPFGKFAEQARKFVGKEHTLASHPEMRRLLDLPEMPDYKNGRAWTEATGDTMNALAELADQPRSSHIDEDTIKGAWARLERRAEERKAPISDDLRETMADTWERHLTAQDNYQNFIVDGRIDNILRRLDQQYEQSISRREAAELKAALVSTAKEYGLSNNYAENLWKTAQSDAASRAKRGGSRAAQEAVRGGSESARAADVRAEGRAERATGTYGRERDTGRGVSAEAPAPESAPLSDYKRFENANKKAIDTLRSVKPEEAATPAGQRRVDALISRLRKSADQMGVDQKHVDAVVTEAQNAQMEAARAADAEARPSETTPAKAKEPWQMTREEYAKSLLPDWKKHLEADINSANPRMFHPAELVAARELGRTKKELVERKLQGLQSSIESGHERDIQRAVTEGKPVPPEVLADYPDLQAKSAPPVAEMRPRAESEAKAAPIATEGEAPAKSAPEARRAGEVAREPQLPGLEDLRKGYERDAARRGDYDNWSLREKEGVLPPEESRRRAQVIVEGKHQIIEPTAQESSDVTAKSRAQKEKPNTGLTPAQTTYLQSKVSEVKPRLESDGSGAITIRVPDDGQFTVRTPGEADKLLERIGKPVVSVKRQPKPTQPPENAKIPTDLNENLDIEGAFPVDRVEAMRWGGNHTSSKTWATDGHLAIRLESTSPKQRETLLKPPKIDNRRAPNAEGVESLIAKEVRNLTGEKGQTAQIAERAVIVRNDKNQYAIIKGERGNPAIVDAQKLRLIQDSVSYDEVRIANESPGSNPVGFFKQGELQALLMPMRIKGEEATRITKTATGDEAPSAAPAKPARKPRVAQDAAKPAGKIDGKDVTADEMAVYDALAKVEPRLSQGAAASFTRARAEAGLSKEAFDKAAASLADKEILSPHYHDFPQSLSPAERAGLVQAGGSDYVGAALRKPGATVERAGEAAEMPVFTESEIITGKPQTTRQKRVNGVSGNVSVEVRAPYKITDPENWSKIDGEKTRATVRGYFEYATGKAPSRKDPVWSVYDQRKNRIAADLTYAEALSYAKSHVLSANPQPSNAAEAPAKTARKPRVKGSVGKLPNETEGGTTLGGGLGALQGLGKLFRRDTAPPKGAELDAWADQLSRAIPESLSDAAVARLDDVVNRAMDAAEAGNAKEWQRLSQQAKRMVFTPKQRAMAEVSGVTNATRSLMASGDLSAPLRQGALLTLPPSQWGKAGRAAKRMLQSISAGKYEQLKQDIQRHPDFDAAEEAGLHFGSLDTNTKGRGEEDFLRNDSLASHIVERLPILAHSERAYKMYLDSLRMDTFAKYKQVIEKGGGTPEQKEKAIKAAAEWINVSTGRGSLGEGFDKAVPMLSTIFFAPRYTASRVQILNPATYAKNLGNPAARQVFRRQMSELFQSAAVLSTTAALAKYGLGATVNVDDPDSPDWLKIKIGNTRYDAGAGLQQIARLGVRMAKYLDTSVRGSEGEQGRASNKMVQAAKTFGRSKLGPVPSFFVDWLNNWTNVVGERHTPGERSVKNPILQRVTPLVWADMVEAYQTGGASKAAKFTPGIFGVGVQDYEVNKARKATSRRPASRPLLPPPQVRKKGFGDL